MSPSDQRRLARRKAKRSIAVARRTVGEIDRTYDDRQAERLAGEINPATSKDTDVQRLYTGLRQDKANVLNSGAYERSHFRGKISMRGARQ